MKLPANLKRRAAAAGLTAALAAAQLSQASGIPVFDGAKFAQDTANWALDAADRARQLAHWVTQLENWKQNLANLVRGRLMEIPAVKEALEKQAQNQINELFDKRRQGCAKLSNTSSQFFCVRTVDLEKEKYGILMNMDADIAQTFAAIKALQQQHAGLAGSNTGSGRQQRIEQDIQIAVNSLNAKIRQHQTNIDAKNSMIAEYRQARVMLSKNQFSGSSLTGKAGKSAAAAVLQMQAADYREKARERQSIGRSVSNRF